IVLGMLQVMEDFGRAQQGFGGNAAPVQANAAEIIALDDGSRKPELRRADRGYVAAGPRADDDDVERILSHAAFSHRSWRSHCCSSGRLWRNRRRRLPYPTETTPIVKRPSSP